MAASKHEEKKADFAIMRANGLILADIAQQLGISQRTAERWNKDPEIRLQIKAIKEKRLEELQEVCGMDSEERKKALAQSIAQIDEALNEKNINQMTPADLLALKLRYIKALREEDLNGW